MKAIIRNLISTQTAALFLGAMLPSAALAGAELPLRGTYQAQESTVEQFPLVFVEGNAWGNASHLGRFSATYEAEVNLLTLAAFGSAHFLAANRDSLFAESFALSTTFLGDYTFLIEEVYTITGGTGRFAGASGTFTVEFMLNVATHQRSGRLEGSIELGKGN